MNPSKFIRPFCSKLLQVARLNVKVTQQNNRLLFTDLHPKLEVSRRLRYIPGVKFIMNPRTTESRSLVILISWVAAQDQKSKFEDLWHRRNFDVIKIRIRYPDTLIPVFTLIPRGKLIADWLLELSDHYDNIVFHTLSAGSYVYSMIVNTIVSQKELYQGLEPILKGAVFDSLLDWDETTPERAKNFQRMMKKYSARVIPKYYRYTYFYSTNTFMHSLELLERNPLDIPGLMLFASPDPYTNVDKNYRIAQKWAREHNIVSMTKCWIDCSHCECYRFHPMEYEKLIDRFLATIEVHPSSECCN